MIWRIPIYNSDFPKPKRIFDVEADEHGNIYRYYTQNIKGCICVETSEMEKQIMDFFEKRAS